MFELHKKSDFKLNDLVELFDKILWNCTKKNIKNVKNENVCLIQQNFLIKKLYLKLRMS